MPRTGSISSPDPVQPDTLLTSAQILKLVPVSLMTLVSVGCGTASSREPSESPRVRAAGNSGASPK